MGRHKIIVENTTDSRVYKMTMRKVHLHCDFCPLNKGCNGKKYGIDDNWKNYKNKQWG